MRSYTYFCVVSESPQHLLLQALNDQNQAAIYKRLATEGVKDWINNRALPKQLDNPIRQFKSGWSVTCLAFASLVSDFSTVRQLVKAGADIEVTDVQILSLKQSSQNRLTREDRITYSALHYACASDIDSDAKVAYLMHRGASLRTTTCGWCDVVTESEFYSTALRLAAWFNQTDRVRALLDEHGASVNAIDQLDRTALHLAAATGSADAVKVLLSHPNSDVTIKARTRQDKTAEDLARENQHNDSAALIQAQYKGICRNMGRFYSCSPR